MKSATIAANWQRPEERAWIQQKQFVADASHELKTPLTVIMTNAELMLESGYTEADRRQLTESIFTMASQMRGLVLGLLETGRTGYRREDVLRAIGELPVTTFDQPDAPGATVTNRLPFALTTSPVRRYCASKYSTTYWMAPIRMASVS